MKLLTCFSFIFLLLNYSTAIAQTTALLCKGSEKISGSWTSNTGGKVSEPKFEPRNISLEITDLTDRTLQYLIVGQQTYYKNEECIVTPDTISCDGSYPASGGNKFYTTLNLSRMSGFLSFDASTQWTADGANFEKSWEYSGECTIYTDRKF